MFTCNIVVTHLLSFGNKQFDISNKLNVLKTDAPYIVDKLDDHKHQIWYEALTLLGINNANTDKRERLITDEVQSNDDLINYYLNCFYKTRKYACDQINEKFLADSDIKIKVMLNKDVYELLEDTKLFDLEGGEEDGSLYDNNQNID